MIELGRRLFGLLEIMANGVEVLWSGILDLRNSDSVISLSRIPDISKESLILLVTRSNVSEWGEFAKSHTIVFDENVMNYFDSHSSAVCGDDLELEISLVSESDWSFSSGYSYIYHVSILSVPLTQ